MNMEKNFELMRFYRLPSAAGHGLGQDRDANSSPLKELVMPVYFVSGYESTQTYVCVEADNKKETVEKAWNGEVVEGTQDSEPGERIWRAKWSAVEGEVRVKESGFGCGRKTYGPKA